MHAMTDRELTPVDPVKYARDERRVREEFWPKIRRNLGKITFVEEALAAYYCTRDPDTPMHVKAVLLGALAYFVLPTDVIPDFIALFGFGDDATVLYAALRTVSTNITDKHRDQARQILNELPDGAPD